MSNKLTKAYELLGKETIEAIEQDSPEGLRKRVVDASEAMRQVVGELEANAEYQAYKDALKELSAGKREVDKRQKAIILVALSLLNR